MKQKRKFERTAGRFTGILLAVLVLLTLGTGCSQQSGEASGAGTQPTETQLTPYDRDPFLGSAFYKHKVEKGTAALAVTRVHRDHLSFACTYTGHDRYQILPGYDIEKWDGEKYIPTELSLSGETVEGDDMDTGQKWRHWTVSCSEFPEGHYRAILRLENLKTGSRIPCPVKFTVLPPEPMEILYKVNSAMEKFSESRIRLFAEAGWDFAGNLIYRQQDAMYEDGLGTWIWEAEDAAVRVPVLQTEKNYYGPYYDYDDGWHYAIDPAAVFEARQEEGCLVIEQQRDGSVCRQLRFCLDPEGNLVSAECRYPRVDGSLYRIFALEVTPATEQEIIDLLEFDDWTDRLKLPGPEHRPMPEQESDEHTGNTPELRSSILKKDTLAGGYYYAFCTDIPKTEVQTITFLSSQETAPSSALDVSAAGDRSVLAWGEPGVDGLQHLFIAAEGKVYFPEDSSYLFSSQHYDERDGVFGNLEEINFNDAVDTRFVQNMAGMFLGCSHLQQLDLGWMNTENVKDMGAMFDRCTELINVDLSSFCTEKVEEMDAMFQQCQSLEQIDLSNFNTENVTSACAMFNYCATLEQVDLSSFRTPKLQTMDYMFNGCASLTAVDLSGFDTSSVMSMYSMLNGCTRLQSVNAAGMDFSAAEYTAEMFGGCRKLRTLTLPLGTMEALTDAHEMFQDCSSLQTLVLQDFTAQNLQNTEKMFQGCSALRNLDLKGLGLTADAQHADMFTQCSPELTVLAEDPAIREEAALDRNFQNQGENESSEYTPPTTAKDRTLRNFDPTGSSPYLFGTNIRKEDVESIGFSDELDYIGQDAVDVSETGNGKVMLQALPADEGLQVLIAADGKVVLPKDCSFLFGSKYSENQSPLSFRLLKDVYWGDAVDASRVETMCAMFQYSRNMKEISLSSFDTRNLRDMSYLFCGCDNLQRVDLNGLRTEKVENMSTMFSGCHNLTELDLTGFNTEKVKLMTWMFGGCSSLRQLDLSAISTDSLTFDDTGCMFKGCHESLNVVTENPMLLERYQVFRDQLAE